MSQNPNYTITNKDALIVADVQNDFLPGGALGIEDSDQIIPVLNEYIRTFKAAQAVIVASRDWHPPKHISFKAQGGLWPPHCVKDTPGAQFSSNLKLSQDALIISKATDSSKEAYSVFDETGLGDQLKNMGVTRFFIGGLATDYCIVNSVMDGRKLGFDVVVLADATRGINMNPGDVDEAFETMQLRGAEEATLEDLPEVAPVPEGTAPPEPDGEKPLYRSIVKKQARMRSRGSYKQIRRERA